MLWSSPNETYPCSWNLYRNPRTGPGQLHHVQIEDFLFQSAESFPPSILGLSIEFLQEWTWILYPASLTCCFIGGNPLSPLAKILVPFGQCYGMKISFFALLASNFQVQCPECGPTNFSGVNRCRKHYSAKGKPEIVRKGEKCCFWTSRKLSSLKCKSHLKRSFATI